MPSILPYFTFVCGLCFVIIVFRLLARSKISEKLSLVWLGGSTLILVLSGNPGSLDKLAALLGVQYPPSLLFMLSTLVLLLIVLYLSIQISHLNDKLKEVAQHVALNNFFVSSELHMQEAGVSLGKESSLQHE
ncbi:DUF2304 domain-containing protein [Paenibacillus sp. YYML68]|uniref:DUF2304 domain-containing protein n=1 Tax=Paenibacillus sp. YYML68 TaxID=2909250 RepID=UPI00248FD2D6|nr:DUF2304 domain-containing protein [Paenibacillus sp. YYML68]